MKRVVRGYNRGTLFHLSSALLIGFSVLTLPLWAQPPAPLQTARLLSEAREPVRIVCFGDSITGAYYHSGNRRAWPEMLKVALNRLYPKADVTVINAGISGNTSAQGLARMQKDVLDYNPHLVVVMFGMNDLAYGAVSPVQDAANKAAFTNNLNTIIGKCRTAGAEVMLCTQNPVYPEAAPSRPPERVGEFAGLIRQTGQELGVPVVDIFTEWNALKVSEVSAWRLLMSETLHPSMAGHKRMAGRVAETLSGRAVSVADVLPEQPVCGGLITRLKEGKPVSIVAPATLEPYVRAMVLRLYPSAALTIVPLSATAASLDALVAEHQGGRSLSPHLVFVSMSPGLLTVDNEETFVRQVSWVVNWSLPFSGTAWTAVGVDPALVNPGLTQPQLGGSDLLRKIVRGHDLDWIEAAPKIQDAFNAWFAETLPCSSETAVTRNPEPQLPPVSTLAKPADPELIVDVDINDEVWMRRQAMTEGDVAELVARLKRNGCQTLLVRCGCLGHLPYRTKLSYPVDSFDAADVRTNPAPGIIANAEAYIAQRTPWQKRYAEVIRAFNPPEVFIREAHKQGIRAIAWIDLFDDYFPGYRSKFLDENPHCQWVGKDGKTYFKGLTDYAWPEARAFRVAQARELLDLGADGIHCSTSAHCRHLPNTREKDFYGYSQPVVDAFQSKYGVDLRTAKEFDQAAWHDLKGDMMVQLYRELAALCHGRGKQLWVGLQLGRYTQLTVSPHFSANAVVRYSNHWKRLVDERLADAFILGDYEVVSSPNSVYWKAKPDIQRKEGEDLYAWAAREYQATCKGKTRLYLFSEWLPAKLAELKARTCFWADVTRQHTFDGIDMHEAWNFEPSPDSMATLGLMDARLKGRAAAR